MEQNIQEGERRSPRELCRIGLDATPVMEIDAQEPGKDNEEKNDAHHADQRRADLRLEQGKIDSFNP